MLKCCNMERVVLDNVYCLVSHMLFDKVRCLSVQNEQRRQRPVRSQWRMADVMFTLYAAFVVC